MSSRTHKLIAVAGWLMATFGFIHIREPGCALVALIVAVGLTVFA